MDWRDIACIVFVCTAVNHLGLIAAIERIIKHSLPVINCPKCLSFWTVLAYGIATVPGASAPGVLAPVGSIAVHPAGVLASAVAALPHLLAISLLCSYLAIWLELIMYAIDTLYNKIYGIIENNNEENRDEDGTKSE